MAVLDLEQHAAALDWCAAHGEAVAEMPVALGHQDGLWLPDVPQARNPRLMQSLREAALRAGVVLQEYTPAGRLVTSQRRVVGVETPRGTFQADHVVVTAGAWSGGLLAELGHAPDIAPVRGQIVLFKAEPGLLPCVVYRRGHYLVPRLDGHILAGSTLEEVGFDKTTTVQARRELLDFAYSVLPALRQAQIVTQWAGLRPGSPGNLPTIDRHPELENLYVNSGQFRYGVTMAPASCEVLLQRMQGTVAEIDTTPYAWK
jgi:glycine oxidase